jgi:hypothetical protein
MHSAGKLPTTPKMRSSIACVPALLGTGEIVSNGPRNHRLAPEDEGDWLRSTRAATTALSSADLGRPRMELVVHAAGGLLVLLVITMLSVFKPWGLTPYGRHKLQERCKVPQQRDKVTPAPLGFTYSSPPSVCSSQRSSCCTSPVIVFTTVTEPRSTENQDRWLLKSLAWHRLPFQSDRKQKPGLLLFSRPISQACIGEVTYGSVQ